jgi:soluble lytic murein transglycosylase-like protein
MRPYADHTRAAEQRHGLPRHLIDAILHAESRGNPKARNRKSGAAGVAQFTAGGRRAVERLRRARGAQSWRFTLADAMDPVVAIYAAAELLAGLVDHCGSLVRALGAYATGQCSRGAAYARRILRYAEWLRLAEEPQS